MGRTISEIVIPDIKNDSEGEAESSGVYETSMEDLTCNHIMWGHTCESKNYDDALSYLSLCMNPKDAIDYIQSLRDTCNSGKIEHYKVRDIFRAAKVEPCSSELDPDVQEHIAMMNAGVKMNPVMLVRGEKSKTGSHPIIADGYHRLSAAMTIDCCMDIPCVVADK